MEKEFIRYEEALTLKELMISVECMAYYNNGILKIHQDGFRNCKNIDFIAVFNDEKLCAAPLYQQAFRWFREKHKLYSFVFKFDEGFGYETYKEGVTQTNESFDTYEEAELECLKKLIEIVKEK
jgi:hypothetical protein